MAPNEARRTRRRAPAWVATLLAFAAAFLAPAWARAAVAPGPFAACAPTRAEATPASSESSHEDERVEPVDHTPAAALRPEARVGGPCPDAAPRPPALPGVAVAGLGAIHARGPTARARVPRALLASERRVRLKILLN